MNKVLPITLLILSIASFAISVVAIVLSLLSQASVIIALPAVVITVIACMTSGISACFGFAFKLSKLCLAGAIISCFALICSIISFILLFCL